MVRAYNEGLRADRIDGQETMEGLGRLLAPAPGFDPSQDVLVAKAGEEVVAWAHRSWRRRDPRNISYRHFVVCRPVPGRRDLIDQLIDWNEAGLRLVAEAQGEEGQGRLEAWGATDPNDWTDSLLQRGYRPSLRLVSMVNRDLADLRPLPSPEGMELRSVQEEDLEAIWEGLRRAMAEDRQFCEGNWDGEAFLRWKRSSMGNRQQWQVAWCDGAVAGAALAELDEPGMGRTDRVFVAKEHRRHGLARSLMVAGLRALSAAGAKEVHLDVDRDGAPGAHRLYLSLGFHEVGELALYARPVRPSH